MLVETVGSNIIIVFLVVRSTSTPKSLGLKHLQSRPKKQQLIDDRNAVIAKDNAQLMHSMTKVGA